jgi:hypothetical protein
MFRFKSLPTLAGGRLNNLCLGLAGAAALGSLLIGATAQATVMTFAASGVGGDGPESASATITTGSNSLIVSLSSLQANPTAAGQEVSDIELKLSNTPTSASLPTGGTGTFIDIAPGGSVTPTSQTNTTHWGVDLTSGTITLATAGSGSVGGKPIELIIGPGPYTNANPSITGRNPQIEDTGVFDLTVGGITSSTTVTSVVFSFGTGPDSFLPGVPVPAPLIGHGLFVLLAVGGVLSGRKLLESFKRYHSAYNMI